MSMRQEVQGLELIGREAECARIDELIQAGRAEQSGALVIRGDVGVGKTSMLHYALEQAGEMSVLRARGVESESELAFAALGDFFRPVLDQLERIPKPQAAALSGALALGPPVAGDRFAICAATLSLLAAVADTGPVVGVIDDGQWLDRSSAEAILFAARRLDSEGVVLLFAVREGGAGLSEGSGLDELVLGGLEREDALELLLSRHERRPVPDVAERLVSAAKGNPLALVELPILLSDGQLAGTEPLSETLLAPAIDGAFLRQIETLPEDTQGALLVAAASESGRIAELFAAMRALAVDPQALDPATAAGLIFVEDEVLEFRHPSLRTAVYDAASAEARRAAHKALAEISVESRSDRRAWHLAAAAPALDEEVASALEEAALEARSRGGHAEAELALERAARLTADEDERARRLVAAADDARIAGRSGRAMVLLDEALGATRDPLGRATIQHLRGAVEMWFGIPKEAHALLVREAALIRELDPGRAARMLTDGSWACFMAGRIRPGLETAIQAQALAEEIGGTTQIYAAGVLGTGLLLSGRTSEARPLLERFEPLLEAIDFARPRQFVTPAQVLTWLEEYERARRLFVRTIDAARDQSAPGFLPYPLAGLSELDFRTGNWAAAYAGAAEAIRIAAETGQEVTHAFGLVCLARVEAAQGHEEDCRAHAGRALEIAPLRIGAVVAYAISTLGLLELGLGRTNQAIANLEALAVQVRERGLGEPAVVQWAPDLIEAYARAGRSDDAARELESFERIAADTQRNWALAAAGRCRGLLASDEEFAEEFSLALEHHDRVPMPFEHARTELCLGERLRRSRRRSEARESLRSALDTFERLGAKPWAERARVELGASGETASRRDPSAADRLTPQELQVALVVGQGATNREAGAALFLSPKTIESHLGRIYRKLDLRSRTDLARLLASEGALADQAA